jgi:hypothetical protein
MPRRMSSTVARSGLLAVALSALMIGCTPSSAFRIHSDGVSPIVAGRTIGAGLVIRAEDGSFALTADSSFVPPFQMKGAIVSLNPKRMPLDGWRDALGQGARRVVVTHGSTRRFGILALAPRGKNAKGPASTSYLIRVPTIYLQESANGRIAYVGETVEAGNERHWTWVLWLSDSPFGT